MKDSTKISSGYLDIVKIKRIFFLDSPWDSILRSMFKYLILSAKWSLFRKAIHKLHSGKYKKLSLVLALRPDPLLWYTHLFETEKAFQKYIINIFQYIVKIPRKKIPAALYVMFLYLCFAFSFPNILFNFLSVSFECRKQENVYFDKNDKFLRN
jgi:hypothetical protein